MFRSPPIDWNPNNASENGRFPKGHTYDVDITGPERLHNQGRLVAVMTQNEFHIGDN